MTSRADQPLTKETAIRQRPEKTCQKEPRRGKNLAGNLGRNHGSSSKQLAAHPTRLYSANAKYGVEYNKLHVELK